VARGVVKRSKISKQIQLEYCFDRLSVKKIVQVYQLLVPDKTWETGVESGNLDKQSIGRRYDAGSNLCSSKRRSYHW
jgi:hypothetical protein